MAVKKIHLNIQVSADLRDRLAFAALLVRTTRGDFARGAVGLACQMVSMDPGERVTVPLGKDHRYSITRLVPKKRGDGKDG